MAVSAANNRRKHLDELKGETAALERKAAKKASELKEYQSIIPLAYRNSASMAKAVLLLRSNKAETFTDAVIASLNQKETPVVFLLWGSHAASKATLITNPLHTVLKAPHPSPLSAYRGFFGCRHFSRTNEILAKGGVAPIRWDNL